MATCVSLKPEDRREEWICWAASALRATSNAGVVGVPWVGSALVAREEAVYFCLLRLWSCRLMVCYYKVEVASDWLRGIHVF